MSSPNYPIGGYAPGNYGCTCITCNKDFTGDKLAVQCEPCAKKFVDGFTKEAAKPVLKRTVIYSKEISDCSKCPYHEMEPDYSADSFSREEKCKCKKLNRIVHRYVGTFDKMSVPEECPLIDKV